MAKLTAARVRDIVGHVEEPLIARLVATGAEEADLLAAIAWVEEDDAVGGETSRIPAGAVGALCAILQEAKGPADEERERPD